MTERIHFSPIHIDSVVHRQAYKTQVRYNKPNGFWFSVQSSEPEWMGWLEWSRAEEHGDIDNEKAHRVEVDESRILMIGPREIDWFNETFGVDQCIGSSRSTDRRIRWDLVAEQFSGIEISPYSWSHRLREDTRWYYGWDCASGCIWDTTAIKSISRIPISIVPCARAEPNR